ncbi:hypothetical protein KUTeg_005933 [Tegillarca granosa]|uniref:Uncharacterized protein n=1 Tax=Tegillarca granosa TaxID=220873 RepID=A0ABQ9FK32_TEGGR|nr:hypothetical protein KUTeg_005933 [Tegillarca granosa]
MGQAITSAIRGPNKMPSLPSSSSSTSLGLELLNCPAVQTNETEIIDQLPIQVMIDSDKTHDVLDFFIKWENDNLSDERIQYDFTSDKARYFHASVIPSRLNNDVVENTFCQQRTLHNGANTNPTYFGYCHSMNSIIVGQTNVSRKSNAGGETAQPYSHQVTKKKKFSHLHTINIKCDITFPTGKKKFSHLHTINIKCDNNFMGFIRNSKAIYSHCSAYSNSKLPRLKISAKSSRLTFETRIGFTGSGDMI